METRRVIFLGLNMPLAYKNQGIVETLSVKTTTTSYRLSDQKVALYGGRGGHYDELQYLRNQNTDATAVNTKSSDAWVKFAPANSSGSSSNRYDQQYHDFSLNGAYP